MRQKGWERTGETDDRKQIFDKRRSKYGSSMDSEAS